MVFPDLHAWGASRVCFLLIFEVPRATRVLFSTGLFYWQDPDCTVIVKMLTMMAITIDSEHLSDVVSEFLILSSFVCSDCFYDFACL